MKDFLSIKNVTFGYGSRTILEDVSLRFGSGQVLPSWAAPAWERRHC